jgi:peptide/nickel transport system substrate-binding protein
MFTASGRFALPLPKHLLEQTYRDAPANLSQSAYWTSEQVGSGPYRLIEWRSASFARMAAFDGYILGRPKIDEIVVRFIRDPNALQANLLAGEIGMTLGKTLSLEQALQMGERWTAGRVEPSPTNWVVIYPQFVDPSPPVVGSLPFREALLYATDRRQLVDSLMAGSSSVADTFVTPDELDFPAVQESVVRHLYDPNRAAQLIESLGYLRGPEGIFRDALGQPLTVEIRANAGAGATDLFEKTLLATADFWQKAGVGVSPVLVPPQQQGDRASAANFSGFTLTRNPSDARSLGGYLGVNSQLPENDYRSGSAGVNRARYMNPEFDGLIDRFLTTVDHDQRLDLLRAVVDHMSGQVIALGLFYDNEPTMIANRLHSAKARYRYSTQAWNVQDWTLTND